MNKQKTAVIIGAGPAGLTAAHELLERTNIKPIILEASEYIGGLSKTVDHKGNKIDIGGHRFFSKSDKVMDWWLDILPIQLSKDQDSKIYLKYKGSKRSLDIKQAKKVGDHKENVMLVRSRKSRIFYQGKFYDYPISLSSSTLKNLGIVKVTKIAISYTISKIKPIKKERNLEDFFINRFGKELYGTFFKDYTEKVWGVSCTAISPDWGVQRIKGLSVHKAILHAINPKKRNNIDQKKTETSLIEHFLYPKYGPGQMWETVAKKVTAKKGKIWKKAKVTSIEVKNGKVVGVVYTNQNNGGKVSIKADYIISSMPVKELIASIEGDKVPQKVKKVAAGLMYRDFLTVGLLIKKSKKASKNSSITDNWIYVQEPSVKVGRIQIFNNWSPYLVKNQDSIWIGMEYFVNESDEFWHMSEKNLITFATNELKQLNIFGETIAQESVVVKEKKAYPAYFGTYDQFDKIKSYTDGITNLFLVGRNGMHSYNNQDHSMLTAMQAVTNILNGTKTKDNIWSVNTEKNYHEESAS